MSINPCRRRRLVSILSGCVILAGCAALKHKDEPRSTSSEAVLDHTWHWVETTTPDGRIDVAKPDRYTIRLKQNGEAQLRFDSNHGSSFYEMSEGTLSLGPLTATRVPCAGNSKGPVYMNQLEAVRGFFTENGFLYLELPADSGTMRFRRADNG